MAANLLVKSMKDFSKDMVSLARFLVMFTGASLLMGYSMVMVSLI